ncbi:hypothetical protein IPG41_06070 [Candidatus Peregrinibacteria bacterium]|nr:MAG: hypothetical protein IPG41_06070 [Candidatus Peregrinibacteria bacterium]
MNQMNGQGTLLEKVELSPPQANFQSVQLFHGQLRFFFFEDLNGNRILRVRNTNDANPFLIQSTAAAWDEINQDGLQEPGTLSLLGEDERSIISADEKIAAHTKKGYRHGKDKETNEDGCVILEDQILLFDGISSGGKGAKAVAEAAKPMSYQAKGGMWPARLMHVGAQKMASERRRLELDPDKDGAAAVAVRNKPDRIECAVVADSKVRIFDVTEGKLVFNSGEQNITGDVRTALEGTNAAETAISLVSAAEMGFAMGWGTQKKVRQILEGQAKGQVALQDVIAEIGAKVKARVDGNSITSSLNPRGDIDKAPLVKVFQKTPGHQYLVLAHTDGLILEEDKIEELLKQARGDPRQAVRLLRNANEKATALERTDPSGYIDDCTVAAMAA